MSAAQPPFRVNEKTGAAQKPHTRGVFAGAMLKSSLGWPSNEVPEDSLDEASARAQGTRAGRAVNMGLAILGVVLLAIGLAYMMVSMLTSSAPPGWGKYIQVGAAGVSLSLLLPALNQVYLTGEKLFKYVGDGSKHELLPELVKCGTTALVLAIAVFAFTIPSSPASVAAPAPTVADSPKELVYLARLPDPAAPPIDYLPFHFDLAVGPSNWALGTTLNGQQLKDLQHLVASLKACVGTTPGKDVEIDVRGYADTNEFLSNSDEMNRQVANRRAAFVHERLKTYLGPQQGPSKLILAKYTEWPKDDPKAMMRERYFKTKPLRETGTTKDQGLLNRRADVLLLRTGACERLVAK